MSLENAFSRVQNSTKKSTMKGYYPAPAIYWMGKRAKHHGTQQSVTHKQFVPQINFVCTAL